MRLLAGRDIDVAPLGIGQGIKLSRLGRVVVNVDVMERNSRKTFYASFELMGQSSSISLRGRTLFAWNASRDSIGLAIRAGAVVRLYRASPRRLAPIGLSSRLGHIL